MFTIHRSEHFTIQHYQASGYVRLVRSAIVFASLEHANDALKACGEALERLDASQLGLLLDWRLGPFSIDARLHQLVIETTDAFAVRFVRCAVLIVSPVGKLQLDRVVRAHSSIAPVIFNEEAAAVEYVTSR
jgi:hypothetical protein